MRDTVTPRADCDTTNRTSLIIDRVQIVCSDALVLQPAVELLREHGVQVTAQRLAIMRVVTEHPHATADELGDVVRSQLGAISRQAVYDTLGVLVDKNLIRRIQPAGSAARYESRVGDNHHHLICRVCRVMFDVDCAVGEVPCLTADDKHGFEVDEAEVIYWGRCATCRAADPPDDLASEPAAIFDPSNEPSATVQGATHE